MVVVPFVDPRVGPVRLIPVLDIQGGLAVHARGGLRSHYRPVESALHPSADPVALAGRFRDALGLDELYVADLDAIEGARPDAGLLDRLARVTPLLWVDAGVRDARDAAVFHRWPEARLVLGLESIQGPGEVEQAVSDFGPGRVVFSLDLRRGQPLVERRARDAWSEASDDPAALVGLVSGLGVRQLLILELERVGSARGLESWALPLLESLRPHTGGAEWFVGGGLEDPGEIARLAGAGCDGILLASALHSGRIGAAEAARWGARGRDGRARETS
jgi:phosphoribosylformimino-5-aminoimidazole carboxamide ribotide isomerase